MKLNFTFFLLTFFAIVSLQGQQFYSADLEVEGANGRKLITLPNGDLLMASSRNDNLHLSRWNGNGDTLWTREHGVPFNETFPVTAMVQLVTGEIVISSSPVAIVNEQGDLLSTIEMANQDIIELGMDSLLGCGTNNIELRNLAGDLLWERPIVVRPGCAGGLNILASTANGIVVYSSCMAEVPGWFFDWGHLYVGFYGNDGTFMDTTLITQTMSALVGAQASTPTADGGILFLGQIASGSMQIIRTNSFGDTLWTRGYGYNYEGMTGRNMRAIAEYPDGGIVVSGWSQEGGDPVGTAIIEMDPMGNILCVEYLESLGPPDSPYPLHSDLTFRPDGTVHVMITDLEGEWPWTTMYGYNELCLSTAITNIHTGASFNAFTSRDELIIELGTEISYPVYTLHNSYGQLISTGRISSSRTSIPVHHYAMGVYLLRLTDPGSGDLQSRKIFIQ